MRLMYLKPRLKDLSQGSRISFVRQFRQITQDELADKLKLKGERKRRTITNYENGIRSPKDERLLEISNILNVRINTIKEYDFKEPTDIVYTLMWIEELYPEYQIDLPITYYNDNTLLISKFINEWNEMRVKRSKRKITYEEYIDWKLNYEIKGE
ncbi:MAG: helix-turn-helix domain-containing protein [Bacilli bacterium]|nr:helix-turn-helix domain-containing protein [Bacilli bacterium]